MGVHHTRLSGELADLGQDLARDRLAVYGYGTFPATVALNMHAVDFLGHGWDVARAVRSAYPDSR